MRLQKLITPGDRPALVNLLTEDFEFWSDGGGQAPVAWTTVQTDRDKTAGFLAKIFSSAAVLSGELRFELNRVNCRPGIVVSKRLASGLWSFDTIMSFEMEGGRIARIYAQRNPIKLGKLESTR
jgi:RNA polymerase sigma-70 factor (ECF subfamily)